MTLNLRALLAVTGCLTALLTPPWVAADTLSDLQNHWAVANYETSGKAKEAAFASLLSEAEAALQAQPQDAEILVWSGIIHSSYAGVKGGLGALKFAKLARKELEQALSINAGALHGSAYTSLGTLYAKVPGWPIGFGNKDKAAELLKQALAINPDGIDPNYFYGEFLLEQGDQTQARRYLLKARQAPARPGREVADKGRQAEISALLDSLD